MRAGDMLGGKIIHQDNINLYKFMMEESSSFQVFPLYNFGWKMDGEERKESKVVGRGRM